MQQLVTWFVLSGIVCTSSSGVNSCLKRSNRIPQNPSRHSEPFEAQTVLYSPDRPFHNESKHRVSFCIPLNNFDYGLMWSHCFAVRAGGAGGMRSLEPFFEDFEGGFDGDFEGGLDIPLIPANARPISMVRVALIRTEL